MSYGTGQIAADRLRQVRGAMLVALYENQPLTRSILLMVVRSQEFGVDDRSAERELVYLEKRGWVSIHRDVASTIGRTDWSIKLTADGEDVARGIDPNKPLMPEDA